MSQSYPTPQSRSRRPRRGLRGQNMRQLAAANQNYRDRMMNVGGLAGAALGFIAGNLPGAAVGMELGYNAAAAAIPVSLNNNNMRNGSQAAVKKSLVQRSAMAITGKTKVKRVKKVKLSSKFVKGVKQVMAGSAAVGTYVTIKQGMVGSIVAPGGQISQTSLGVAGSIGILTPSHLAPAGSRTLFNCLSNWATGTDSGAVAQTELNFFTPAKILDAASVLFNAKPLGDPYLPVGNLSTTFIGGTNVTVTNRPGQLKINVLSSSVDFELKNISNRVVTMEIWECTPTVKFMSVNPLEQVLTTSNSALTPTTNNNILYFRDQPLGTSDQLYHEQSIDPLVVLKKYAGLPLTWKKRSMILAPDETCYHTITGPTGVMDYSKLVQPQLSNPVINTLLKNWSVGCIISINGDQVLQNNTSRGDKMAYSNGVNPRMAMPVSIQVCEHYKIAVPEIAGFISQTPLINQVQTLNLRKPKVVVWNQVPANGTLTFQVSNEQQPMTDVAGGQTA